MVAHKWPREIQNQLESLVKKIDRLYSLWILKNDPEKSQVIIYHHPLDKVVPNKRKVIKNSKYLNKEGPKYTLFPTKKSWNILVYTHIIYSEWMNTSESNCTKPKMHLNSKADYFFTKIICYMLLIRPIITYAAPIWSNTSASTMEKIRKFCNFVI